MNKAYSQFKRIAIYSLLLTVLPFILGMGAAPERTYLSDINPGSVLVEGENKVFLREGNYYHVKSRAVKTGNKVCAIQVEITNKSNKKVHISHKDFRLTDSANKIKLQLAPEYAVNLYYGNVKTVPMQYTPSSPSHYELEGDVVGDTVYGTARPIYNEWDEFASGFAEGYNQSLRRKQGQIRKDTLKARAQSFPFGIIDPSMKASGYLYFYIEDSKEPFSLKIDLPEEEFLFKFAAT